MRKPQVEAFAFRPTGMPAPPHTAKVYPSLASLVSSREEARLSVCIVTPDLLGPVKNGGIGTACTHLAFALAHAGHRVHILFSQCGYDGAATDDWLRTYTPKGIAITVAEVWQCARHAVACFPDHPPLRMAKTVYDWLSAQPDFDLILFMEWQGHGFYAMQAKACGLRFQNTALATITHSPSLWHCAHNAELPSHPFQAFTWHMERASLTLADAVISPSNYMLDWCAAHGCVLPEKCFVQPNVLELPQTTAAPSPAPVSEVVFFGRLEYRKGLEQFCNALDRLEKRKHLPQRVTFLGKFAWMGTEHAAQYIARRSAQWKKTRVILLPYYGQAQALDYLGAGGRLAVMPSVADNSPYTVYECLLAGIPFLARRVGGVAELLQTEDHSRCLFSDNPSDLADKIVAAMAREFAPARLAFDPAENRKAWSEGLSGLVRRLRKAASSATRPPAETPRISICLTHNMRPRLLEQAVNSLLSQEYPDFEVILADDGSTDAASHAYLAKLEPIFAVRSWKILRLPNGYLGRARNTAAREANGEYLLFMDDDNVARPGMLTRFAQAATASGADLVVSVFDIFSGMAAPTTRTRARERYLPLGGAATCAVVANTIGDAHSLMRKATFECLGGFSEDYGLGHEDFELYLRAVLHGASTAVIPEATFWYRRNGASMLFSTNATANALRGLRPFLSALPAPLGELALVAHALVSPPAEAGKDARLPAAGPDAPETVLAVAELLESTGQKPIARQLVQALQDIDSQANPTVSLLRAWAQKAARQGNPIKVREHMRAFAEQETTQKEKADFHCAILEALPTRKTTASLRREALDALRTVDDGSVNAALMLAKHGCILKQDEQAAADFALAVERASAIYLRQRPDVAQAVKSGQFESALHHYVLHGKRENSLWPEEISFKEYFKRHIKITAR